MEPLSEATIIHNLTTGYLALLLNPASGNIANDLIAMSLDKLASLHVSNREAYLAAIEQAKTDALATYAMQNSPLIPDARQFLATVTGSNILRPNPATGEYEAIK